MNGNDGKNGKNGRNGVNAMNGTNDRPLRRGRPTALLSVVCAGVLAVGACSSDDRALVTFTVKIAPEITAKIKTLQFVSPDHPGIKKREVDGESHRPELKLGYYVPSSEATGAPG